MSELSIGEYCLDVNRSGITLPDVVQKQTRASYKSIFLALFQLSELNGEFELNALALSKSIGYSRKTIYQAIDFLKRVNLLKLVEQRTGRGNHSTYYLNWRKRRANSSSVPKSSARNSTRGGILTKDHASFERKCHPNILIRSFKEYIHPTGDKILENKHTTPLRHTTQISPRGHPKPWRAIMKYFRGLIDESSLPHRFRRLAIGVLGRAVKNKNIALIGELFVRLESQQRNLYPPEWVKGPRRFSRWFRGVLNTLVSEIKSQKQDFETSETQARNNIGPATTQPEAKDSKNSARNGKRFSPDAWRRLDVNERQWQLVSNEKERIAKCRHHPASGAETYEDEFRKWALEQLEEQRYRQRMAEKARERLRAKRAGETS